MECCATLETHPSTKKNILIIALMSALLFLGNFDFTAVILVLPQISAHYSASLSEMQWIMTGYIVSSASFILMNSQACDFFGEKKTFLIGCSIFTLTSIACGISESVTTLIIARFIQGIGYALSFPLIYSFVYTAAPEKSKGFAISILHATTAISQIIGPSLGGFVAQFAGWRMIFLINVPICLLITILAYHALPSKPIRKKINYISVGNSFLLLASLIAIMFLLNQNTPTIGLKLVSSSGSYLAISIACFIIFIARERLNPDPLINKELWSNKNYVSINIIRFIIQIIFIEFLFFPNLYLQNILDYDSFHAGISYMSMTTVFACSSIIFGKMIDHSGPKLPLTLGILSLLLACIILYVNIYSSFLGIIASFIFAGIGIGATFPSTLYICMHNLSKDNKKIGTSIFLMNALIGCSFGISFFGFITQIISKFKLDNFLQFHSIILNNYQNKLLGEITTGAASLHNITHNSFLEQYITNIKSIFISSLSSVMIINIVILLSALILCFNISNLKDN